MDRLAGEARTAAIRIQSGPLKEEETCRAALCLQRWWEELSAGGTSGKGRGMLNRDYGFHFAAGSGRSGCSSNPVSSE